MTKLKNRRKVSTTMMLLSLGFLFADQLSKMLVGRFLTQPMEVFENIFKIEKSFNEGIAFGIEFDKRLIMAFSLVILLFLFKVAKNEINFEQKISRYSFALVLGGALGNITDRLMHGKVLDFIDFAFWPSFNLADMFIVVGVVMIMVFHKKTLKNRT